MKVTCVPASPDQYAQFYALMAAEPYFEESLDQIGMSVAQFQQSMQTVGQVESVVADGVTIGFCWVELRGRILHLHGIALAAPYQGKGIGTRVLTGLTERSTGMADAIELGVHNTNSGAIRLYERLGFRTVRAIERPPYLVMQKPLGTPVPRQ